MALQTFFCGVHFLVAFDADFSYTLRMDLRTLRKRLRYSQEELGRIAGVRAATISDIERGKIRSCAYATVTKLATALEQPAPVIAAAIEASYSEAARS